VIKLLGQGMQLDKIDGEFGHRWREKTFKASCDTAELLIALAEVANAIKLVEKEACRRRILAISKKICVGVFKPDRLQPFDRLDR